VFGEPLPPRFNVSHMHERLPLLAGLAALAVAFVVGAGSIAGGIRDRGRADLLSVTGSAKTRIVSDHASWKLTVEDDRDDAAAAARRAELWSKRVREFMRDEGVRPGELTVSALDVEALTDETDGFAGYGASRTFTVSSGRVAAVAALAEASSRLALAGIPIQTGDVAYTFTKLADIRPRLLAEAAEDAKRRAQVLVAATGAHLGAVRTIDVGVFQITAPGSTEVSDYGEYDTGSRIKDVTSVVNLAFAVR